MLTWEYRVTDGGREVDHALLSVCRFKAIAKPRNMRVARISIVLCLLLGEHGLAGASCLDIAALQLPAVQPRVLCVLQLMNWRHRAARCPLAA